jgi:cysteine dioxygenase
MADPRLPDLAPPPAARAAHPTALAVEPRVTPVPGIAPPFPAPYVPRSTPPRVIVPGVVPAGYAPSELPAPLRRLCIRLEDSAAAGAISLEVAAAELDALELDLQALAPWWIFDAVRYRRNLIRRTADYEMLLLCWLPGQSSPIHDHRGSACAFRVMEGIVSETIYEHCHDDVATPAAMRWLPPATICASRDFDIHQVANTQPDRDLVTLHLYSPPLRDVNLYRAADSTPLS